MKGKNTITLREVKDEQEASRLLGVAKPSSRPQMKLFLRWGGAALIMVVLWFALFGGHRETTLLYKTQPVRRGDLTVTVTASGVLEPTNEVEVGSELSGIVESVSVDYNDWVKEGQILAKLDTTKLKAQVQKSKALLQSAQARVLEAEATEREARKKFERLVEVRKLSNSKVPSQQDLDTAQATLERAEANTAIAAATVSEASATLELNETDLRKSVIRSPINGMVLSRSVEPGQTVAASFQAPVLFTIAENLTQMELHVDIDEADVGQITEGQQAEFSVDAYPQESFSATISQVRFGSQTVDGVVTYETVLMVDNSSLSLRPGMTATADITVKSLENIILVPNAALRFLPAETEELSTSSKSIFERIFPRPGRRESKKSEKTKINSLQKRVWALSNNRPQALSITTGATDGSMTQVLDGSVEEHTPLIIDTIMATE